MPQQPSTDLRMAGKNAHFMILQALRNPSAVAAVFSHDLEFFRRQLAWLEQDGVGNADLANVVQLGRLLQHVETLAVPAKLLWQSREHNGPREKRAVPYHRRETRRREPGNE